MLKCGLHLEFPCERVNKCLVSSSSTVWFFFRILLVRLPLSAVIADEERGSGCYERILYVLNLN